MLVGTLWHIRSTALVWMRHSAGAWTKCVPRCAKQAVDKWTRYLPFAAARLGCARSFSRARSYGTALAALLPALGSEYAFVQLRVHKARFAITQPR